MLRHLLKRIHANREGTTAIEFAIVAPVLVLLMFGLIEFSIMMATQGMLESTAQQVARQYKASAGLTGPTSAQKMVDDIVRLSGDFLEKERVSFAADDLGLGTWGRGKDCPDCRNNRVGWYDPVIGAERTGAVLGQSAGTDRVTQYRLYYAYYFYTPFLGKLLKSSYVWETTSDGHGIVLRASAIAKNEPEMP